MTPDEAKVNAMLAMLQRQRDIALNDAVILQGEVAVLKARVEALEAEKRPKRRSAEKKPPVVEPAT